MSIASRIPLTSLWSGGAGSFGTKKFRKIENEKSNAEMNLEYVIYNYKYICGFPDIYSKKDLYVTMITDKPYPTNFVSYLLNNIGNNFIKHNYLVFF